jgi:hypothetical protein
MGDAMGKSRHTPWLADFSGQWCATVQECITRRALSRINKIEEKKCHCAPLGLISYVAAQSEQKLNQLLVISLTPIVIGGHDRQLFD